MIKPQKFYNAWDNGSNITQRIATPEPTYLVVLWAGALVNILIRAGTALSALVTKNPKLAAGTIATTAITEAIKTPYTTELERIRIIAEIANENPGLAEELARKTQSTGIGNITQLFEQYGLYVAGLGLAYILLKD
ncbi:MAG: hypothetical protein BWK75_04670 [Candidatus Altiarchaeales archaeon A3]|nr:MAG: hypothetical protein BWK75_04670 [Candidatus Altiarchaeales archaeon A3]